MSVPVLSKGQIATVVLRPAGPSAAAAEQPAAPGWQRALDMARATAAGAPVSREPRPLRPLAQPFANPPRWAPQRADDTPPRPQPSDPRTPHPARGDDRGGAARSDEPGAAARRAQADPAGHDSVDRSGAGVHPAGSDGAGAAAPRIAVTPPVPRRPDGMAPTFEAPTGPRAYLAFVSNEGLQDLPLDLPWQEDLTEDAGLEALMPSLTPADSRGAGQTASGPLRLYAEWTPRGVRVWIGADHLAAGAQMLPLLQRWIASRGERLLSLVCNGRCEFEAAADDQPRSFQPELAARGSTFSLLFNPAGHRPATPSQENPWRPVP